MGRGRAPSYLRGRGVRSWHRPPLPPPMMHPTGYRGGKAVESRRCRWADATCSEVVSSAADGDQEAWNELHRRYNRMIARVASSSGCAATDVSDVQQAVWMRLLQHIHRLRQPDALGCWLVVVTR